MLENRDLGGVTSSCVCMQGRRESSGSLQCVAFQPLASCTHKEVSACVQYDSYYGGKCLPGMLDSTFDMN